VAKPELGMKRQCLSCGSKFYDLNRSPILCPKCGAQFQVAQLQRRPEPVKTESEEEEDVVDTAGADLVPLEEADGDTPEKDLPGDDIDLGEDIDTDGDDTFLEQDEEEEDGDVSDLIGGDIEEDEEG
jgi:uncharacterized protein (TIGR02300 family)